jgi:hypothetical protein
MGLVYKLSDYSIDVRTVSAKWLFDEIQQLRRSGTISDRTKRRWKTLAGVPNESNVRLRKLTPNEAARIVFLSLWDETIKPQIGSRLKAKDFENALLFSNAFNAWMDIDGGGKAATILRAVKACNRLKGGDLKAVCDGVAKKQIPETTFRRWLTKIGHPYHVNQLYDPGDVLRILNLITQHAQT